MNARATVTARRTDTAGGFSEEARFFGPEPQRLFGVLHRPAGPVTGGLVICPSIHAELVVRYRTEVLLARTLASSGVAVHRFHYRGTGHSEGETEMASFATMRDDALAAAERLQDETGVDSLAFLGTSFGALLAASAAAEHPGAPLVFLDPPRDGKAFFRDAWRAMLIRRAKAGTGEGTPPGGIAEALEVEPTVEILGYGVTRRLFESAVDRTLAGELGTGRRQVLLVWAGRASSARRDVEGASTALQEAGCDVEVELIADDTSSWFLPRAEKHTKAHDLLQATSGWIGQALSRPVPA